MQAQDVQTEAMHTEAVLETEVVASENRTAVAENREDTTENRSEAAESKQDVPVKVACNLPKVVCPKLIQPVHCVAALPNGAEIEVDHAPNRCFGIWQARFRVCERGLDLATASIKCRPLAH